jgi:hypothetical protein
MISQLGNIRLENCENMHILSLSPNNVNGNGNDIVICNLRDCVIMPKELFDRLTRKDQSCPSL